MSGAERGLRVGVVGATGALGGEILAVLDESSLRVAELVPVATDRSLGEEIEFQGSDCPVLHQASRRLIPSSARKLFSPSLCNHRNWTYSQLVCW